jgi:hypothetical protein
MRVSITRSASWRGLLMLAGACTLSGATGCQVDIGGQTLPSPYYQDDDVQYFPPGPEFKLSKEAAAMKAYKEEAASQERAAKAGVSPMRRQAMQPQRMMQQPLQQMPPQPPPAQY